MTAFELDGVAVETSDEGSLLDALRDELGATWVKDGCSPQGQCGSCTVLVDGQPRIACVIAVRRVAGRSVTTVRGLPTSVIEPLAAAFDAVAASQCGFCSAGICTRLSVVLAAEATEFEVRQALAAHQCRCTGWQPIVDAAMAVRAGADLEPRDPDAASARALLEGGVPQRSGTAVPQGQFPYAADQAVGALRAVGAVGAETLVRDHRAWRAAQHPGRATTLPAAHPLAIDGDYDLVLETGWTDPAYVEPDAAVGLPDGTVIGPDTNGGAFGAKSGAAAASAQRLATEAGRAVLVAWSREEVAQRVAKRPPLALGLRRDGTGLLVLPAHLGEAERLEAEALVAALSPGIAVRWQPVIGPPVSLSPRGAIWAEVAAALAVLGAEETELPSIAVEGPLGGEVRVSAQRDGSLVVEADAGDPLCAATLRSYLCGAVHHGLSMVLSESIALDATGVVADRTLRSAKVLPARATPELSVVLAASSGPPVPVGAAAMAAAMAVAWSLEGRPRRWPTRSAPPRSTPLWSWED